MTDQLDCDICCNSFSKKLNRFPSTCCPNENICTNCVEKSSISSIERPSCLFCNNPYSENLIESSLTKTAQNRIHKAQSELFCESQVALLPATQPYAEREIEIKSLEEKIDAALAREKQIRIELSNIGKEKRFMQAMVYRLKRQNNAEEIPEELRVDEIDGVGWRVPCAWDSCNGFVSKGYKCGLCSRFTCSKCQMPKDENHMCNESDLASVNMIKNDTKACPSCSTRIYKISGCSQMFCVKPGCNTIFDWNTLKIQKNGFVHNPHALDFRRNGGLVGDGCYNEFNIYNYENYFFPSFGVKRKNADFYHKNCNDYRVLRGIVQQVAHSENLLRLLQYQNINLEVKLRNLRVKFLLKEFDKNVWVTKINTLRKKQSKDYMYLGILDIVPETLRGLIQQQDKNIKTLQDIDLSQIREFGKLVNDELIKLNNRYKVVGYSLPELLI